MDLNRYHPRPCLQYYIGRCLGPCVEGLTTPERYAGSRQRREACFSKGEQTELARSLRERMDRPRPSEQYELAAKYRDLISTVEQLQEKQRIAAAEGDDADVFGYHYENGMLAVNLFHMRGGKIVDRREFFWDKIALDGLRRLARCAIRSRRVLLLAPEAALPRPALRAAQHLCSRWTSKTARRSKNC